MNVFLGWQCDWCGGELEFVNDYVRCSRCWKDSGKDGKRHFVVNGRFVEERVEEAGK